MKEVVNDIKKFRDYMEFEEIPDEVIEDVPDMVINMNGKDTESRDGVRVGKIKTKIDRKPTWINSSISEVGIALVLVDIVNARTRERNTLWIEISHTPLNIHQKYCTIKGFSVQDNGYIYSVTSMDFETGNIKRAICSDGVESILDITEEYTVIGNINRRGDKNE